MTGPSYNQYVTHAELNELRTEFTTQLDEIWLFLRGQESLIANLKENQVATQADVDALTAALQAEDSELSTSVSGLQASVVAIQAEITQLQQANPTLDLSALTAEVTNSKAQADAVQAAVASAAALVPPATS